MANDRLAEALGVDFRYYLKESENSKKWREMGINVYKDHRHFQALEIGPYKMSIQASALHYCTPRKTLENLLEYSHWEVGMLDEADLPEIQELFKDYGSWYKDSDWVYNSVPTELIEQARQLLEKKCT